MASFLFDQKFYLVNVAVAKNLNPEQPRRGRPREVPVVTEAQYRAYLEHWEEDDEIQNSH